MGKNNLLSKIGDFTKNTLKKTVLYASIPLAIYGCEKENEIPEVIEDPNAALYSTTKVLERESLNNVSGYSENSISFLTALDDSYKEGDILIGGIGPHTPYGLSPKKITSISNDRKRVNTSSSTLEEAVQNATMNFNREFYYSDVASQKSSADFPVFLEKSSSADFNFHLYFKYPVYDEDNNFDTKDDQINVEADLYFNLSANGQFKFNHGNTQLYFNTTSDAEFKIGLDSKIPLSYEKEMNVYSVYFHPFVITTPVPLVFVPKFEVNLGIEGNVTAGIMSEVTADFYSSSTIMYDGNNWASSKETDKDFGFNFMSVDLNEDIKAYAEGKLELLLYGITGPNATIEAYSKLHANVLENPWYSFSVGLNGTIGYEAEILSRGIAGIEFNLFNLEEELANAGGPFIDEPDDSELDSAIISLDMEGKDAWVGLDRFSNCEEVYSHSGEDTLLKVNFNGMFGCGVVDDDGLIEFPLGLVPENKEIHSAHLNLYGYYSNNFASNPQISLSKITQSWDENVEWTNKPEAEEISGYTLPYFHGEGWCSMDVTQTVKDAISEEKIGFEISANSDQTGGYFYSSDYYDSEKRPKLVVYYKK